MEKEPLISVIVPVFNVAANLAQCLRSLLKQTYQNWEVILVNDASYDRTGQICRDFAAQDSRVTVIQQPTQQGVAVARNVGLAAASGEYVTFVDGDDFVDAAYLAHMYQQMQAKQADIVIGGYYELDEQAGNFIYYYPAGKVRSTVASTAEVLQQIGHNRIMTACSKLYRRTLFEEVAFPDGWLVEDICVVVKLYTAAQRIVLLDESLYCIRQRQGSMTRRLYSFQQYRDTLAAHFELVMDYLVNGYDPAPAFARLEYVLNYYRWYMKQQGVTDGTAYRQVMYYAKRMQALKKK